MDTHQSLGVIAGEPQETAPRTTTPTIGIFDSGIGGFTVAQAILSRRPDLNLVYFGDTLNMPYGGRPLEQLARFARNSIEFLIGQGIDILAVGCNASNSVLGQGELKSFGLQVFDLVSSTIDTLQSQDTQPQRLALVATEATVNSRYWQRKLADAFPNMEIREVAAREFVPLVEAYSPSETAIRAAVKRHLEPLAAEGITTVLHGCTHFPLLQHYMEEVSPEFTFIDPAQCLADHLVARLNPPEAGAGKGVIRLYSSLPGETFYRVAEQVLGQPARPLTSMYIVNPYED